MRLRPLGALIAYVVGSATTVAAQPTAYLLTPPSTTCSSGCPGQVAAVDLDGRRVLWTVAVPAAYGLSANGVYTTPDGRYVVWQGARSSAMDSQQLGLLDVTTRQVLTIPLPLASTTGLLPPLLGHPGRPEVYTTDASGPIVLSPAGARALSCTSCSRFSTAISASADSRRVLYFTPSQLVVFDTASGAVVSELALRPGRWALSRDGEEIYSTTFGDVGGNPVLRRYRVSDGQVLLEVTLPAAGNGLHIDPRTGEAFVFSGSSLTAYAETSLAVRRSSPAPWWRPYARAYTWMFDPNTANVYVGSGHTIELVGPANQLVVFDSATFDQRIALEQLTGYYEFPAIFAPAPRPGAPALQPPVVAGGTVQLAWAPAGPGATVHSVLEVGSAPGLSDLFGGLELGPQTALTAVAVPSGTYYVRVRAGNYTGLSAPSNEVVVQVP